MDRSPVRCSVFLTGLWALACAISCERPAAPRPAAGPPRIASLVPAATEILLAIGARDRLVAVSNYDSDPGVSHLPRVGDYQSTEWETLAAARPSAMIIQGAPDRIPPGLKQRADDLGIELVNIRIDRLDDIYAAMERLGEVARRPDAARSAQAELRGRLDRIRRDCADRPPVRVLLVRDVDGREVVGPGNYLDDILKVVNATNAAGSLANPYPTIDPETVVHLAPEAVIVLLPEARPQDVERSGRFWSAMTGVPAVARGRVYTVTERHTLLPGPRVADLAGRIARCLNGPATTRATSGAQP